MENQAKEQFVHSVFQNIAHKYDRMNDIISFRRHKAWRRFTMSVMDVRAGQSAIDLCCGTCDWTIDIAEASKTGRVVGLDFSENMLEFGRTKIREHGLQQQIELVHGNAMSLPFVNDSFDYATIGFGLRNVPDFVQVLEEMKRVVRPGGRVVCLDMSKPRWQPFKMFFYLYFKFIMPQIGKLLAKRYEQYKWLPESLTTFPDHKQLADMFQQIGLQNVKVYTFAGGVAALHIGTKGN